MKLAYFALALSSSFAAADALLPMQKQLVLNTFQSYTLAATVARSVDPSKTATQSSGETLSSTFSQMLGKLQDAIASRACTVAANSITANGTKCPVVYSSANGISTYVSGMLDYLALNDIVAFTWSPTVNGSSIYGSGALTSQTLGILNITITGTVANDEALNFHQIVNYAITFPGFNAVLIIEQNETLTSHDVKLTLNGTPLTDDERDFILLPNLQPQPADPAGQQSESRRAHLPL